MGAKKTIKNYLPHESLSSKFFSERNQKLTSVIRNKLLDIAYEFIDYLGIPIDVLDITMTGSYANYNYTPFSDIDLHIIVNYEELTDIEDLAMEFFKAKKNFWNDRHDIKVKGVEIELYAQDISEVHSSTGVYSVKNNKWLVKPKKFKTKIDENSIYNKFKKIEKEILKVLEDADSKDNEKMVTKFIEKIRKMRKSGLEKSGELAEENLVYKIIRDKGYLQKLYDLKTDLFDRNLSY